MTSSARGVDELRERVRERVRDALLAELGTGASSAPDPGSAILTEDDIDRFARDGAIVAGDPGWERWLREGRLTSLARETLARLLRARPTSQPAPAATPIAAAVSPSSQPAPSRPPTAIRSDSQAAAPASPSPPAFETIAVGADHGGFALKQILAEHLRERGFAVQDCGTDNADSCDYPVFARRVAEAVAAGDAIAGVVVDGAGIGSAMTVNKVPGVRAAHCHNTSEARNAREHNHAHVVTLGAGFIGANLAKEVVDSFLATPFGGDRHARRVAMMETPTIDERSVRP